MKTATGAVSRVKSVLWTLVYLYPVWLPLSFYLSWGVAWITLGHPPRPMLDDPKYIGGLMDIANLFPMPFVIAMPAWILMGLASAFYCPFQIIRNRPKTRCAALVIIYIGLFASAFVLLRADPLRVVEWWFD